MTAPSITFRLDAGPAEGLGHLQRCLVLATYLKARGCQVRFVCRSREEAADRRLAGYPVLHLDAAGPVPNDGSETWDAEATLKAAGPASGPAWMVVDHYQLGADWERIISQAGYRVAVIDDLRDRAHHADLLISDSPAPFDPALNGRGSPAPALTGSAYALVSGDYAAESLREVSAGRRIVVTFGAADPTGETKIAIEAIGRLIQEERLPKDVGADIVIGPLNRAASELSAAAQRAGLEPRVAPPSLAPLMRAADLVVTAGGNSLVEALTLLKPAVVTVTAENQRLMAEALQEKGLLKLAGDAGAIDAPALANSIAEAWRCAEMWARRIAAARPFDHLGAQRIGDEMLALGMVDGDRKASAVR